MYGQFGVIFFSKRKQLEAEKYAFIYELDILSFTITIQIEEKLETQKLLMLLMIVLVFNNKQ